MGALRRDFLVADLMAETASARVDYTVAVQARQSLEETRELLSVADANELVAGVVGWLPIDDAARLAAALEAWGGHPALVGVRHVVEDEPEGFLDRREFNEGIVTLRAYHLTYDLLVRADQLPEAIAFVDRHPEQRFVLDHLAKPRVALGEIEPWRSDLLRLGERPNVWCKVSGLATEADWGRWSATSLRPYLDTAMEAFGAGRLLAGSDWPVCLVACEYARWWKVLRDYFGDFSRVERAGIFGGNAMDVYRIADPEKRRA